MKLILTAVTVLALAGCNQVPAGDANTAAPATATPAALPDLKGTWVGTSESMALGSTRHHAAAAGPQPLLDNVEFTTVIEGQQGRRFWGTITSKFNKDAILGVIAHDGQTILARSGAGEIRGRIVDPATIEITYSEGGPATVVSANTWKRQR